MLPKVLSASFRKLRNVSLIIIIFGLYKSSVNNSVFPFNPHHWYKDKFKLISNTYFPESYPLTIFIIPQAASSLISCEWEFSQSSQPDTEKANILFHHLGFYENETELCLDNVANSVILSPLVTLDPCGAGMVTS